MLDIRYRREFSSRRKLGEEATHYLRDGLLGGAFAVGQRMTVDDIARQMGISAMPVREALVALAGEGLVEALPRRGYRVVALQRRDVEDTFRVHAFVAGLLAEDAVRRISVESLMCLRELQTQIEEQANHNLDRGEASIRVESLNYQFHKTINHISDANRLRWFLRVTTRYVPRSFHEAVPGWTQASATEHPAILDAMERHQAERARELMSAHVSRAGRLVMTYLESRGLWGSKPGASATALPSPDSHLPWASPSTSGSSSTTRRGHS